MSADLFAEFFATPSATQQQQTSGDEFVTKPPSSSNFSFFDNVANTASAQNTRNAYTHTQPLQSSIQVQPDCSPENNASIPEASDEWGDFEGSSFNAEPSGQVKQNLFAFSTIRSSQPSQATLPPQRDQVQRSMPSTTSVSETKVRTAPLVKAKFADPAVLFDAEDDFDDEDDFGDFENSGTAPDFTVVPSSGGFFDLLGDLSVSHKPPAVTEATMPSEPGSQPLPQPKQVGAVGRFGSPFRSANEDTTHAITPVSKQEAAWGAFDEWEASIPSKAVAKPAEKPKASAPPMLQPTLDDPDPGELAPTNVPPPMLLLTLFPPLFANAQNTLFKPMAVQNLPMRNKLLSDPATVDFLQGYLMLATVAAHIIAGRKLRWKRDQHLSQGMRIGPASSRATSGMKLSSIDKSENLKEEREASDVVRAWKDQIGKLRHAASAVNQIKSGTLGAVPDIQETMAVKVLRQSEGGIPAARACMLCGLKRDERVAAVDQEVEDSFGEFWIDQVNMHRTCRNFWNEHKNQLKQR